MIADSRARRVDLHMHSTRSDGRFEPEDVLRRCARGGLDIVALTDHDLATSFEPGSHTVDGRRLHLIGGAEISGTHAGSEQHLLVYFPGPIPAGFSDFCTTQAQGRVTRYEAARRSLGLEGVPEATDSARRGEVSLTRYHLAKALVTAGHARDMREAFARYVGDSAPHVPPVTLTFLEAIRVARAHGGITSWAHPQVAAVRDHLGTFAAAGLHAIEGLRPHPTSQERRFYRRLAQQHSLMLTGGSDWHGWHDGDLGLFVVDRQDIAPFLDALAAA